MKNTLDYNPSAILVDLESLPAEVLNHCQIITSSQGEGKCLNTPQIKAAMAEYGANKGKLKQPDPTLILLDFRTFAYPIFNAVTKWECLFINACIEQPLDLYHAYYLKWLYVFTQIPDELRRFASQLQGTDDPNYRIVIVDDCPILLTDIEHLGDAYPKPLLERAKQLDKPIYWRHVYEPDYKGGRKSKPETWQMITSSGYEAAEKLGLPIVKESYMEADDIIAQYVRDRESYAISGLAIWTVDTDLLQLVTSDEPTPVVWYNSPFTPYYRDEEIAKQYWLKRWKHKLNHPSEIAAYKAENGDASDNLGPGTDLGLIDLLNPKHYPRDKHSEALSYPLVNVKERDELNRNLLAELLINQLGVG